MFGKSSVNNLIPNGGGLMVMNPMVQSATKSPTKHKSKDGVFEQPCEVQNWLFTGFCLGKIPISHSQNVATSVFF